MDLDGRTDSIHVLRLPEYARGLLRLLVYTLELATAHVHVHMLTPCHSQFIPGLMLNVLFFVA